MAKKKDFTAASTGNAYTAFIGTALADGPEAEPIQAAEPAPEAAPVQDTTRRNSFKHFCISLTKERHDFITTMAAMHGMSASKYFDALIDDSMERYADIYNATKALRAQMQAEGPVKKD